MNTTDIEYLKLVLGIDEDNPTDISIQGQLEADGIVAGAFTVKVSDDAKKTLGQAKIEAGKTEKNVETEAASSDSRIFVTPDQPVEIGANDINNGESFRIEIGRELEENLLVSWWIVESR